jgi:hypothetical protein
MRWTPTVSREGEKVYHNTVICAYFSLVPCLAKRSMGNINQDAPIYETRRVLEPGFTFRHSADWPSWRQLSVFECFETVCGVIERSVQAHLG